jgi:hypothetical protein
LVASETRADDRDSWLVPSLHAIGIMTAMRVSIAVIWPRPFADTDLSVAGRHYREAFTRPPRFDPHAPAFEWDGSPWTINVIGHGAFGSEVYLRARTCRRTGLEAFALTTLASTTWEYLFEGNAARPSAQDLVYTPIAGLVFGELRFRLWRAAGRLEDETWRAVWTSVLDPLGELERALGTEC